MAKQRTVSCPEIPRIVGLGPKGHAVMKKTGKTIPVALAITTAIAIGAPCTKAILSGKTPNIPKNFANEQLYRTHIMTNLGAERVLKNGDSLLLVVKNNNGFVDPTNCKISIDETQRGRSPVTCDGETSINGRTLSFSYDIEGYKESYLGYMTTTQTHAKLDHAFNIEAEQLLPTRGNAFTYIKSQAPTPKG